MMTRRLRRPQPVQRDRRAARPDPCVNERIGAEQRPCAEGELSFEFHTARPNAIEIAALTVASASGDEADAGEVAGTRTQRDVGDRILEPVLEPGGAEP